MSDLRLGGLEYEDMLTCSSTSFKSCRACIRLVSSPSGVLSAFKCVVANTKRRPDELCIRTAS